MPIPNKEDSLFRTGLDTSEKFKSQADKNFEKKEYETYKKLIEEIERQNSESDYGV